MFLRIRLFSMLAAVSVFQICFAQSPYSKLETVSARFFKPTRPELGTEIRFEVNPQADPMNLKKQPNTLFLLISTDLLNTFETVAMRQEGNGWKTTWMLQDTSARSVLFGFRTDAESQYINRDAYYELLVYEGNKPRKGALMTSAISAADMGSSRRVNLGYALLQIDKELKLYPDNYSARLLQITLLLKTDRLTDSKSRLLEIELEDEARKKPRDKAFLTFAIQAFRQLGKEKSAYNIQKQLVKLDPEGEQAIKLKLGDVLAIEDAEKRSAELERLLREHPESPATESILAQLATAIIESQDSLKMVGIGDRLMEQAKTPQGASALAGLAGSFAEKRFEPGRAVTYAQQAVFLLNDLNPELRPPEMGAVDWEKRIRQTRAKYIDILGWSQILNGDAESGIHTLKQALETLFEPGVFFHLAEGYTRLGNRSEALTFYARASAFGGEFGKLAYASFSDLWAESSAMSDSKDRFLKREENWIAQKHRERILEGKESRPAPDFELEDVDGGRVRLSDQRGSVVLLCFWATWSQSSVKTLREVQSLTDQFGPDILFLTVAMDPDADSVFRFLDDTGLILPVLLNDGVEKMYGLSGVPVTYVIDAHGKIQFEHKGYRPDLTQVLRVEINNLLGRLQ